MTAEVVWCLVAVLSSHRAVCVLFTISYQSDVEVIIDSACQEQELEVQLNDIEEEWSEQVCVCMRACVRVVRANVHVCVHACVVLLCVCMCVCISLSQPFESNVICLFNSHLKCPL